MAKSDRDKYLKSLDQLTSVLGDIVRQADEQSLSRCPYKNVQQLCTAPFGCRNQRKINVDREKSFRCDGDDKLDYRTAWESNPDAESGMRNLLAAGQVPADKAAMPKSRPATDARRARLSRRRSRTFLNDHKLPDEFLETAGRYYNPLAAWLAERIAATGPMVLGINGAQGTGKSTLAAWLKTILEIAYGKCVAVLSIDDFYLTKAQRIRLAAQVHPLFVTRGVPGTHDVAMAIDCIEQLRSLETGCSAELPRFDKSLDERAERASWPTIEGPVDLVILEGWCVGALPQAESDLAVPVNELEADADESGVWRRYVNTALSSSYRELFELLDALVFFKAPDFDTVLAWRLEQEVKLAETTDEAATGIMDAGQIAVFVQHFERLTRANLDQLPAIADVVLELDREHRCTGSTIDDNTAPD